MVYRVYVEKKSAFAVEADALQAEFVQTLNIQGLRKTRIVQRYDIEGVDKELFEKCVQTVLSEAPVDKVYYELPEADFIRAVEYLPGQFDQRSDSAAECIQLISHLERPRVLNAKLYLFEGRVSEADKKRIEAYLINPVDSRRADLAEKETLQTVYTEAGDVESIAGFTGMTPSGMKDFIESRALAMDVSDLAVCVRYFKTENRNPTITELRVIDAYWSDHCRHTTFNTILDNIEIEDDASLNDIRKTYQRYLEARKTIYGEEQARQRPVTLMDIAVSGANYLSRTGKLKNWDRGIENNACSIKINVDNDGKDEEWLLLFKNETHNHPTEIEPFGGAATCIGGAIRDPLSGRAYVYQAMRVSGAGNPLTPIADTPEGKLPQRKIVISSAQGYSSYGNQIGLATGLVKEFYHPGYTAKRMEIGAVLGAVPANRVRREEPAHNDVVILVGGRTGRDGCGGAAGSSKAHKKTSLENCGAEVQKGNAPVERALQRLFRNPKAALMIKRCNDFGAGGAAVAIGELAAGLSIDLDAIPKKYEGLDGTELAISESQERMAVVVDAKDAKEFIALAAEENLEAAVAARVTEEKRLVMKWRGKTIVNISRDFLNSNGAEKHSNVKIKRTSIRAAEGCTKGAATDAIKCAADHTAAVSLAALAEQGLSKQSFAERLTEIVSDLNVCGAKGLFERFDSTIGAGTILMPAGGIYQLTPAQGMAAKIPVEGETETCSGMAFGFDPAISEANPYDGAYIAVLESAAKLIAAGFPLDKCYLTFQEYFPRLRDDAERWGKPFAALLGAFQAQIDLGIAAIGGKDSMSGSFEELDVPPTLVSFAVSVGKAQNIIGGEFKKAGHEILWIRPAAASAASCRPQVKSFTAALALIEKLTAEKKAVSVYVVSRFGAAEALFKMSAGNRTGVCFKNGIDENALFEAAPVSFIVELNDDISPQTICSDICSKAVSVELLGKTTNSYTFEINGQTIDLKKIQEAWETRLESIFPCRAPAQKQKGFCEKAEVPVFNYVADGVKRAKKIMAAAHTKPRALIPVFPGTNCEYDTARALRVAGAESEIFVIKNLNPAQTAESAKELAKRIGQANMLVIPGGFSGGDEPDGSAKLIAAFFRGPAVADAVMNLLEKQDGLILGICNGFQALIKLGLVPFGAIKNIESEDPTLTFNTIGRHQSVMVRTRICSTLSPWFLCEDLGAIHTIPVSHGEGRFAAGGQELLALAAAGQIAAQYVDLNGSPTMDIRYNPAGSLMAIEALSDPSGRVLGKMAHSERRGACLYKNIPDIKTQKLFEGGVKYFLG
ncbi:MAG: phosphoribosylformylglycinamidine synthase [Spirochaetaceae bacterium]|jgi:phosphoribosylformylglycinamidine synthase|nr:phosphoribosylformylglycinamidine synthase [Spirochaetaceae bacterium]